MDREEFITFMLDRIAARIRAWDHEDVEQLGRYLEDATYLCREGELDLENELRARGVDLSELPSEPVPEDLTGYPVWALDRHGRALVDWNEDDAEIVPIDEIREWMERRDND